MDFAIRHFLPGRVRLRIELLFVESPLSASMASWLTEQDGIAGVRINAACASVVIEYDRNRPEIWARLLFFLRHVSVDALKQLVQNYQDGASKRPKGPSVRDAAPALSALSHKWPLAGPTISLGLAFFSNPIALFFNLPLIAWNSVPIVRRAWRVLTRERRLNVDFLDVLAISASSIYANYMAAGVVIWLIHLGDWIRDLTAARSKRAVSELLEYRTKHAWLLINGEVVSVPSEQLVSGDTIMVYPGEMIPVDGEVLSGVATIDQKTITGEGLPVTRGEGEIVYAATVLRDGQLTMRAIRVGNDTTAAQIVHLVEAAPVGETRMQNHAEMFADRLVLPSLGLAIGTAAVTADFNRFLNLVIIDYGTGIRVAAPTSVLSSMTHAARQGILIKGGGHMERLAEVDTIVFDKTGTLTQGIPKVKQILAYKPTRFSSRQLLGLAAAAESRLQHPVAEAIRARAMELDIEVPECIESNYRIGLGVEARINGYFLHVGSERFLRQSGIRLQPAANDAAELNKRGYSSLFIAVDGEFAGLIPYADQIREESPAIIQALHNLGIKNTIMLTGDNATVASAVGAKLGLTRQYAGTMPADKAEVIRELRREGKVVAMVGDGINDSAALSYADVGIAMKHGAEVTHESAHVILMEDSLWKLVAAIEISRGAVRLIKQNYAIVAGLNTLALAFALPGGLISPTLTAIISNGSAVVASLNGLRPILRYQ